MLEAQEESEEAMSEPISDSDLIEKIETTKSFLHGGGVALDPDLLSELLRRYKALVEEVEKLRKKCEPLKAGNDLETETAT